MQEVLIMRHYHTKDEEDLIKQIEADDELSKEFEDAELVMWSLYVPQHRSMAYGRFAKRDMGYRFKQIQTSSVSGS